MSPTSPGFRSPLGHAVCDCRSALDGVIIRSFAYSRVANIVRSNRTLIFLVNVSSARLCCASVASNREAWLFESPLAHVSSELGVDSVEHAALRLYHATFTPYQ